MSASLFFNKKHLQSFAKYEKIGSNPILAREGYKYIQVQVCIPKLSCNLHHPERTKGSCRLFCF